MRLLKLLSVSALALLAGCASKAPRIVAVPPAPVVVAVAPLPPGATPGMRIPDRLADGSYPTPNRALSQAAALWHLRAGLNVAALSCRGAAGDAIVAGYNAMLVRAKAVLAAAEAGQAADYRAGGAADWRDAYDDAMTRLYNYYSQTPARAALCVAAEQLLAEAATLAPEALPGFAQAGIARLDRPFTDFYRDYDAWRAGTVAVAGPSPLVIATAAAPAAATPPRLAVDPAVFAQP